MVRGGGHGWNNRSDRTATATAGRTPAGARGRARGNTRPMGRVIPSPEPGGADQGDVEARLGRALLEAVAHSTRAGPAVENPLGGAQVVSATPARPSAQVALMRAGFDREMRIAAGRRARRLPYLATAATAAAGYGAWGAAQWAEAVAGSIGLVGTVAGTVGLCAAGLGALRITYRHGIAQSWRRTWWSAGIGAAAWVSAASAIGPASWSMSATLAAGSAAASAGWLRAHAVADPGTVEPKRFIDPDPEPEEEPLSEILARRWAEAIGRKGGVVPGSVLTGCTELPNALQWMIQTPPGSVSFDQLLAARPRIAAGLRQSLAKVIIEPIADDESAAMLSVITRDVLAEGVPYLGPRYRDHRVPIGPYADGTGEADYVAVDGVGCRNGLATGAPGSGKSAFLEAVALGLKASGCWYVLFGDGDPSGGSSPLLNRLADWAAAGPDQVLAQLEALERLLVVRSALKNTLTAGPDGTPIPITDPTQQVPLREMLPCSEFPGVVWILDELHRLTQDEWLKDRKFAARLEKLARIGRKYGIVILAGTQSLLADDFGGNTKLRAYLSDRNCFVFRNPNKTEQHAVAGLRIAPSSLPTGGGYAYSTGTGRVSMLRVAWARDMSPHLAGLPTVVLDPDGEQVMAGFRPADAGDPVSLYSNAAARLRELRTGQPRTGHNTTTESDRPDDTGGPDSETTGPVRPQQRPVSGLAGIRIPAALTADNVIPIRRPAPSQSQPGPVAEPSEPGPVSPTNGSGQDPIRDPQRGRDLAELNGAQRTVYDALTSLGQGRVVRSGQLTERTGMSAPTVSKALNVLAERGLARKVAHGEWATHTQSRPATAAYSDTTDTSGDPMGDIVGDMVEEAGGDIGGDTGPASTTYPHHASLEEGTA